MGRQRSGHQRHLEHMEAARARRLEEDRRQRAMVIAEFDAEDPEAILHALAGEILRYRDVLRLLAEAIGWAQAGAPFGLIGPGPLWRPRRTIEDADAAPPAA